MQPATTTPQKGANIVKARPTGPLPIRLPVAQQQRDVCHALAIDPKLNDEWQRKQVVHKKLQTKLMDQQNLVNTILQIIIIKTALRT